MPYGYDDNTADDASALGFGSLGSAPAPSAAGPDQPPQPPPATVYPSSPVPQGQAHPSGFAGLLSKVLPAVQAISAGVAAGYGNPGPAKMVMAQQQQDFENKRQLNADQQLSQIRSLDIMNKWQDYQTARENARLNPPMGPQEKLDWAMKFEKMKSDLNVAKKEPKYFSISNPDGTTTEYMSSPVDPGKAMPVMTPNPNLNAPVTPGQAYGPGAQGPVAPDAQAQVQAQRPAMVPLQGAGKADKSNSLLEMYTSGDPVKKQQAVDFMNAQAAQKISERNPEQPKNLMVDTTGRIFEAKPGMTIPPGSTTITQSGSANTPAAEGKWMIWNDPKTHRTVAGPESMAKAVGAENPASLDTRDVQSVMDARGVVTLAHKQGKNPEDMGILQLIDSLDKDGKLGVAASRVNSFLAGKVGAEPGDDPRIMSLLNKTDLMMTLSMKAHFGASGGRSPQMLEHFLNMANAKTMNANTLRAGVKSVDSYMQDRAMIPDTQSATPKPAQGGNGFHPNNISSTHHWDDKLQRAVPNE